MTQKWPHWILATIAWYSIVVYGSGISFSEKGRNEKRMVTFDVFPPPLLSFSSSSSEPSAQHCNLSPLETTKKTRKNTSKICFFTAATASSSSSLPPPPLLISFLTLCAYFLIVNLPLKNTQKKRGNKGKNCFLPPLWPPPLKLHEVDAFNS